VRRAGIARGDDDDDDDDDDDEARCDVEMHLESSKFLPVTFATTPRAGGARIVARRTRTRVHRPLVEY